MTPPVVKKKKKRIDQHLHINPFTTRSDKDFFFCIFLLFDTKKQKYLWYRVEQSKLYRYPHNTYSVSWRSNSCCTRYSPPIYNIASRDVNVIYSDIQSKEEKRQKRSLLPSRTINRSASFFSLYRLISLPPSPFFFRKSY